MSNRFIHLPTKAFNFVTWIRHYIKIRKSRITLRYLYLTSLVYSLPLIISLILTKDPVRKPKMPKATRNMFFHRTQLKRPSPLGLSQNVTVSTTEGKINPKNDRQTAPTNEMNGPKFGIAMAMHRVRIMMLILIVYSAMFFFAPNLWRTFFQMISMGT